MDIHELSANSGVSLRTLRKLDKLGALNLTAPINKEWAKAKLQLKRKRPLTVLQLLAYLREPSLAEQLTEAQGEELDRQIADLGNLDFEEWEKQALPLGTISQAAGPFPGAMPAIIELGEWIKDTIPAGGCSHYFLAVRLLWIAPPSILGMAARQLNRALASLRMQEEFKPWYDVQEDRGSNRVRYYRPALQFDL